MINNKLDYFKYFQEDISYNTDEVFFVRLDPEIGNSDELLKAINYLLWFPGYFGFNWNALYDCLCDLSWIPYKKVVLVHYALPQIPVEDLKIYLNLLSDAASSWKEEEEHVLEVMFQEKYRTEIEKIL